MKKILKSLLVCMAMIATVLLSNSYVKAEDTIEVYDGVKYRVNNEQKWASICGYSGDATDLEIPFMVGRGIIVSQIDDHAFDGCSSVRILTLPDTIVKVGDMSFIGMDNLQAVISKAQGINIVVRDNVKIVTDRSQLDSNDINNDDNNNNNNSNSNSSNNTNGGNTQGNDNGDSSSSGNGDSGSSSVGSGGAIIDSDNNVIIDSSNGTVIEENIDKNVGDSSATISGSDNKKDNNKSTQAADSKNDTGYKTTKKSSAPKIIAYIVCVIVIIGLAAGAIIFIKKKRR
ncbi:hypothetical protein DW979_11715 [Eubacterium sp. AM49-13BH]|jgi:hypothetical protein|nr:hypothetical protein DW979_11715 [Eubacterium sp. AM49-13BH]